MKEIHVDKNKVIQILDKMEPGDGIVIHKNSSPDKSYSVAIDKDMEKKLHLKKDDYTRQTTESESFV